MQVRGVSSVSFGMTYPLKPDGSFKNEKNPVSFGYSNELKTLFKKGKLPSVIYDAFGEKLTPDNVSLDHIIPKSEGGLSKTANYMLATQYWNHLRGSKPLSGFLTPENLKRYLDQFVDVIVDGFNGNKYIKDVLKTLEKAKNL
jgi:hypothetical protein